MDEADRLIAAGRMARAECDKARLAIQKAEETLHDAKEQLYKAQLRCTQIENGLISLITGQWFTENREWISVTPDDVLARVGIDG